MSMTVSQRLLALQESARDNARLHIFPFWTSEYIMDRENGGFYGKVTLDMVRDNTEPRSLVLTGRMIYAFSGAYLQFGDSLYLERAKYAYDYLMAVFHDREFGGAFSSVDCQGAVLSDAKPLYSEAFFIMACAAYYRASGEPGALRAAMETFDIIETRVKRGPADYPNNLARDWSVSTPAKMGKMMFPADITMFPHHLCQAYEQLWRASGDERVKAALHEMAVSMATHLYDRENRCFCTIFDKEGKRYGAHQSYGHDCELSYLAMDVAELTGDGELIAELKAVCTDILYHVLETGFDPWHSLYNGINLATGEKEKSHVWWAQAEAVTAMLLGYQLTGDEAFLTACENQLQYIDTYFINQENGDWYNNVVVDETGFHMVDGMHGFDKLNGGKCPFHNSHMCFEVIRRTDDLLGSKNS